MSSCYLVQLCAFDMILTLLAFLRKVMTQLRCGRKFLAGLCINHFWSHHNIERTTKLRILLTKFLQK